MALIKCPECGHQVSDSADTCPQCGFCISQYIFDEKVKEKRKEINSKAEKDTKWVEPFKRKVMRGKTVSLVFSLVFFICFLVSLVILVNGFIYMLIPLVISITGVIVSLPLFGSSLRNFYKIYKVEGSTILFYYRSKVIGLVVDGVDVVRSANFDPLTAKLESGSIVHAEFVKEKEVKMWIEDFSKFETNPNVRNKTIVNNYVTNNITKTGGKTERSDMEKILIKNAKIDALASIDPTNTEKSKEQIKIVKELDDLD